MAISPHRGSLAPTVAARSFCFLLVGRFYRVPCCAMNDRQGSFDPSPESSSNVRCISDIDGGLQRYHVIQRDLSVVKGVHQSFSRLTSVYRTILKTNRKTSWLSIYTTPSSRDPSGSTLAFASDQYHASHSMPREVWRAIRCRVTSLLEQVLPIPTCESSPGSSHPIQG